MTQPNPLSDVGRNVGRKLWPWHLPTICGHFSRSLAVMGTAIHYSAESFSHFLSASWFFRADLKWVDGIGSSGIFRLLIKAAQGQRYRPQR